MAERATNRIRVLREKTGDGPTAVAAELGKSLSTYLRYEAGTTAVPDEIKRALATRHGVTVEYLMGWDSEVAA